ncbi:MAG: hydrogenase maturation protease [Paracoccaceae bacterium]|nr:hydrogenase maturation protease [Paracoccaceae bacterium]
MEKLLILGVGNALRSDDGVGPYVAARLAAAGLPARVHEGDGTGIIDAMSGVGALVVVDATRGGAAPGTRVRLDARAAPLPAAFFHYSTHRFGLAEAVETARALDLLPPVLIVHGIEGADFGPGEGLSAPAAMAAGALVQELRTAYGRA